MQLKLLQMLADAQREGFLSVVEPLWTVVADVDAAVALIVGATA